MSVLEDMEKMGHSKVTVPCAECFSRLRAADHDVKADAGVRAMAARELGYDYQGKVEVEHVVDTFLDMGTDVIRSKVTKPLSGLKVVCYYGCLLTRPPQVTEAPHPENPTDMDELMAALGVEVLDWSYKTSCCGAAHSLTRPDIVLNLSGGLIEHAREAGADVMVVACPLCHSNLDARQFQMKLEQPMPVLYFTQLMAVALGLPEKAALDKNLVDPRPVLRSKGVLDLRQ